MSYHLNSNRQYQRHRRHHQFLDMNHHQLLMSHHFFLEVDSQEVCFQFHQDDLDFLRRRLILTVQLHRVP